MGIAELLMDLGLVFAVECQFVLSENAFKDWVVLLCTGVFVDTRNAAPCLT